MKKFSERRRLRKVMYSRVTIAILVVAVFFFSRSVWNSWEKYSETSYSRAEAQERLRELEEQKESLEAQLELMRSTEGQEEILRDRFDVAAPGEEVINIVNTE